MHIVLTATVDAVGCGLLKVLHIKITLKQNTKRAIHKYVTRIRSTQSQ